MKNLLKNKKKAYAVFIGSVIALVIVFIAFRQYGIWLWKHEFIMKVPDWKKKVEKAAKENGLSFEEQLDNEAKYMLKNEGMPAFKDWTI